MPIAIVLSPVVSWIPRVLARAFAVCLAVPFIWAVCFAASGAMLNDGLFLKGSSGFFDALLEPLAAIALLWLMLLLPSRLAQMAMLGAGAVSGGFVSRAVSYAAGSQIRDSARQHMPSWAGGQGGSSDQRARATDSRLGARLSAESVLAASKAASAGATAGAAGAVGAGVASASRSGASKGGAGGSPEPGSGWRQRVRGAANARAYSPPPLASSQGAVAANGGLQRPSWRQEDFDAEMLEASLREQRQPVSPEQARQALDALPAPTQGAVQSLVADHGPRARQHLAYQALGEWTPEHREAIRTLAAASPEVRAQAFSDGGHSTAGFGESVEPAAERVARSGADSAAAPPARSATGNGGNGTPARAPQDQPRPDDGGRS